MTKCIGLIVSFVLASCSEHFDDPAVSLLQLRSSSSHKDVFNSSSDTPTYSGHEFGCTGQTKADEVIACGLWGDVHQHKMYSGRHGPDSNGQGWYWVAKSFDGSFQAQAFYRQGPWAASTMSHFAFKFGDEVLFMDRVLTTEPPGSGYWNGPFWDWRYYWNGEEKSYTDTPMDVGPVYWVNKAAGNMAQTGSQQNYGIMAQFSYDPKRTSCFEYQKVAVWTCATEWQPAHNGPHGQTAIIEVEGSIDFLDKDFGQCAGNAAQRKVDPSEMLVTVAQNEKVCKDDKLDKHQCEDPDPPPDPKTAEELCEDNGVDFSHAENLCADQKVHGDDVYDGCVYDVCASIDADAQQNAVGVAELESALMDPVASCTINQASCTPCDICSASTSVDLSNVVQNNLGGLGPDSGTEEIRYKNAIDLDGRKLDVVLTVVGEYKSPKPMKNGYTGTGFGRFLMKTKTASDFKFSFVDATTGEPVGVKDIALTFYDLDQAKKTTQQETISACGAEEVYTTSDTELTHKKLGACHSFTSTTRGTGKDNPAKPDELTKTQAARSVTFEFHSRASISFSAAVSGKSRAPRPVLFSFKPQVACGASDAETQCTD